MTSTESYVKMGNVQIVNESNISVNFGMYVYILYHSVHDLKPNREQIFNIGCVWFSFGAYPWYETEHDFSWYSYRRNIGYIAGNLTEYGEMQFHELKFICKENCSKRKMYQRLRNLLFWENDYFPCSKKYCITGGPGTNAVSTLGVIDLTEYFDKLQINKC